MLRKILIQLPITEMLFSRAGARAARCCWEGCKQGHVVSRVHCSKARPAQARPRALPRMSTRLVVLVPATAGYLGLIPVGIHIPRPEMHVHAPGVHAVLRLPGVSEE